MKHLSLDLFGTLIQSNPRYKEARVKVFQDTIKYRYGINLTAEEVGRVLRESELFIDKVQEETCEQTTLFYNIRLILNKFIIKYSSLDNVVKISHIDTLIRELDEIWFTNPPSLYKDCEGLLDWLASEGVTFNILSNTALVRGVIIDKWLSQFKFYENILFSLYSDLEGLCKPESALFDMVKYNVGEKTMCHVGDNEITDGACINSGILFVHVNNKDAEKTTFKLLSNIYAQPDVFR